MRFITAPTEVDVDEPSIFLAGSIEQGDAPDWQSKFRTFKRAKVIFLNPRRKVWDRLASRQTIVEQIKWEQHYLKRADLVVFAFLSGTFSPISLLEFGQCIERQESEMIVWCDSDFWRATNVETMCQLNGIPLVRSEGELHSKVAEWILREVD